MLLLETPEQNILISVNPVAECFNLINLTITMSKLLAHKELQLRKASMSVALSNSSCLHLGQTQGLRPLLVTKKI